MDDLKTEINRYLFREFDVDGDESRVSETWPFELRKLVETADLTVIEFHDDQAYFALADDGLNFIPQAAMGVDDLMLQRSGATWLWARDPIDLSEVRLNDPTVPSSKDRRRQLESLGAATLPGRTVEILEGLFLGSNQQYLGLFRLSGRDEAIVSGLPDTLPIVVPFAGATGWRRLAWGVGWWLERQGDRPR